MMMGLRFYLFGNLRIVRMDDRDEEVTVPPSVQSLLAYLLLHRQRSHRREILAGVFWGEHDETSARRCLNTALWRLRRELHIDEEAGAVRTLPSGEVVVEPPGNCWLDVAAFEEQMSAALSVPGPQMTPSSANALEAAVELYTGELLEGFYDDWVLGERERLRLLSIKGLARLVHYYRRYGPYHRGLDYAQRLLDLDPLREQIHREMMRLYLKAGHRAAAVQQYQHCRAMLADELGIAPMAETQALYLKILDDAAHEDGTAPLHVESREIKHALRQLSLAAATLNEASSQLRHTAQLISDLLGRHEPH